MRPWEDTSITAQSQPASAISRRYFCTVTDSGVVLLDGIFFSLIMVSMVPISPT